MKMQMYRHHLFQQNKSRYCQCLKKEKKNEIFTHLTSLFHQRLLGPSVLSEHDRSRNLPSTLLCPMRHYSDSSSFSASCGSQLEIQFSSTADDFVGIL